MLPNLLVIGAMKCGTTSIHNYLNLHPEIYMHKEKELDFFIDERNYKKGLNWYKSKFKRHGPKIFGESSSNYTKYPLFKNVPEKIYISIPNVKMIYVVRDPIDRIISHYKHNYILGREKRSFKNSFKILDDNKYVYCSMYHFQLKRYLKYFKNDNIYILDSENLLNNTSITLESIFKYLEVNKYFVSKKYIQKYNKTPDNSVHNKLGIMIVKKRIHMKINQVLPEFLYKLIFFKKDDLPSTDNDSIEKIKNYINHDINNFRKVTGLEFNKWQI